MRIGNRILSTGQPYTLIQFGILYNHLLSVGLTQSFKRLQEQEFPMNAGSPSMCVHPAWALIRAERASQLPIHPSVASVEGSFLVLRTLLAVESTAGGSSPCCPSGYTSGTSEIPATTGRHGSCDFVLLSTPGQLEISFSPPPISSLHIIKAVIVRPIH